LPCGGGWVAAGSELLYSINPAEWHVVPTQPWLIFKPTCESLNDKHAAVVVILLDLVVVRSKPFDPYFQVGSIENSRNGDNSICGMLISRIVN
jgi:hypothetical protein